MDKYEEALEILGQCDDAYKILSRGGLSTAQLYTLHLIRLLANDLDPEFPKFKSTLDSIEHHVQALKRELKIDRSVQDCAPQIVEK